MKIIEAMDRLDELKHNTYTQKDKIEWLSRLDGMVKRLIIDTHEGGSDVVFDGYNQETPVETDLLVPAPYDEMYLRWMEAQIDYHNGEYDKYNNAILLFNSAFDAYSAYYHRIHRPAGSGRRFLF